MPRPYRRTSFAGGGVIGTMLLVLAAASHGVGGSAAEAAGSTQAAGPPVIVAFGGDLLLGGDMNRYVAGHGAEAPLAGVPELGQADLALANLESVVAPGVDVVDTGDIEDYHFLGRPEMLGVLEAAGIDLVSTANNHARDFGTGALAAQDRLLTGMGIAHPGTGWTVAEACGPVYLAPGHLRIAVFSVDTTGPADATGDGEFGTCYLAPGDREDWQRTFRPAFADARLKADVVLVLPHFRASLKNVPDPADRAVAQLLIDLGADAVLGAGAHAVQGIEVHKGRPILHNAGSLVFNFPEPDETAIFLLSLSSAGVKEIRTVPLIAEHNWTRPASPADAGVILASMDARSRDLGTRLSGGSLELAPPPRDRPTVQPENVARLNPGPAPGPDAEPPAACAVEAIPEGAGVPPAAVGPLTLVGARVDSAWIVGPALIWLETFWRIDARTSSDLLIAPRALPGRGAPWHGDHEPCHWAWPTSRWEPGVIYRDRHPLRPPPEVQRLGGIPALLTMSAYGELTISVEVRDEGGTLGESGALATVILEPAVTTQLAFAAGAVATAGVMIVAFVFWRRRRVPRTR